MGLFTNNDKRCPICGAPTPRILPTKVQGMPICSDCDVKKKVDSEILNQMTVEGLKEHLVWIEQNKLERNGFQADLVLSGGFLADEFKVDTARGSFLIRDGYYGTVFHCVEVSGITVSEDSRVVFDTGHNGANWEQAPALDYIDRLGIGGSRWMPSGNPRKPGGAAGGEEDRSIRPPFEHWKIRILVQHPYWRELTMEYDAPYWNRNDPDIRGFRRDYEEKRMKLQDFFGVFQTLCPLLPGNQASLQMQMQAAQVQAAQIAAQQAAQAASAAQQQAAQAAAQQTLGQAIQSAAGQPAGDRFCPNCRKMVNGRFCPDCGTQTV